MDDQRYARLLDLFDRGTDLPASEHARFVAEHCGDDAEMAQRLSALLAHDAKPSTALDGITQEVVSSVLSQATPMALFEGQMIGAYRIGRLLGSGGMGRVYLAHRLDGDVEHAVAVKFVRPDRVESNVLARFSRERRVLASLQHPGICTFIDAGTLADGSPYVVMEYVEGEPLLDYCKHRRLGIRERLLLLRKIFDAVSHAHARLIVHRDIKGSNVLVTPDGEAKLLDFGIAKSLTEADYALTATSERFLTPINASPELLHGEPTGIGCDVYALGVLAYELLAGRQPLDFTGLRGAQIEELILSVPPPPMSQLSAITDEAARERGLDSPAALSRRLRGDLDAIVLRCLRKSPSDRYRTVSELDADVARHLEQQPIHARRGDRLYRLGRFVARYRVAVGMSLALLLSLLAGTLVLALQSAELARQRNLALIERDHAQQVVQVLRDAFQYADPARAAGDEVSARQILDAARPRLDTLAEGQPHLFAALADTLSGVELALASDAKAAELAQRGLAAAEAIGADPALIRRLRLTAARALTNLGDLAIAQDLLDSIRAIDPSLQPDWAVAQARLYDNRTLPPSTTIDLLHEAMVSIQDRPPEDEVATEVHWQLAETLRLNGRYEEAYEALSATLAWQTQHLPDNHPRVALTKLRRLNSLYRFDSSESTLLELKTVVEQLLDQYGPNSSIAGTAHNILGAALRSAGHDEAAITHLRLAWEAWHDALGKGHANTLRVGLNLARALAERPDSISEASEILYDVLSEAERRFRPESPLSIHARVNLAQVLGNQGLWREALLVMGSESAGRGDRVGNPISRQSQIDMLRKVLAGVKCPSPTDQEATLACSTAQALLERLLRLEN